jgi:hypothetical protein
VLIRDDLFPLDILSFVPRVSVFPPWDCQAQAPFLRGGRSSVHRWVETDVGVPTPWFLTPGLSDLSFHVHLLLILPLSPAALLHLRALLELVPACSIIIPPCGLHARSDHSFRPVHNPELVIALDTAGLH